MSTELSLLRTNLQTSNKWAKDIFVDPSPSLREKLALEVERRLDDGPATFNPYLIDQLLADISKTLDRCLLYRREAQDLEVNSIKQVLELALFDKLRGPGTFLESEEGVLAQREAEKEAQDDAAAKFSSAAGKDNLAPGLAALATGNAKAAQAAVGSHTARQEELKKKWDTLKNHNENLKVLTTNPGSSLNYKWRYERIVSYLLQDFGNAYVKAMACAKGLKEVYGIEADFPIARPKDTDLTVLDSLVIWIRNCIFDLEVENQGAVEFEVMIPVVTPNSRAESFMTPTAFKQAMQTFDDGSLTVDLTNYFASVPINALRCRAVGMSYVLQNGPEWDNSTPQLPKPTVDNRHKRGSGVVIPPPGLVAREPVIIPCLGYADRATPLYGGPGVYNANPAGVWTMQVNLTVWYPHPSPGTTHQNRDELVDVNLHLQLIGKPMSGGKWNALPW